MDNKIDQLITAAAVQDSNMAARLLSEAANTPEGACAVRDLAHAASRKNPAAIAYHIDMDGTKEKISVTRSISYSEKPVASITLERCDRK